MKIFFIVAVDEQNGIGKNQQLLCHLPADLKYFKTLTTGHTVLMGRKTYESIGKALPNRCNIVISSKEILQQNIHAFTSIEDGIAFAKKQEHSHLFIIGGDSIYQQTLALANVIYITRIHHTFNADAFFPVLNNTDWQLTSDVFCEADEKNLFNYSFQIYHKLVH